jgi:hypothetical protein
MRSEGGGFRLHMRSMGRSVESWISSRDQWKGENRLHEISRKQTMGFMRSLDQWEGEISSKISMRRGSELHEISGEGE